jgi:hypothetical protein
MVAGDVRANENIALTATHTLFAREHNRIVAALPPELDAETKFEIARRIVGAEQQYVTYNEFLPALGVTLSPYRGYDPNVDPSLSNEFAVVGSRTTRPPSSTRSGRRAPRSRWTVTSSSSSSHSMSPSSTRTCCG